MTSASSTSNSSQFQIQVEAASQECKTSFVGFLLVVLLPLRELNWFLILRIQRTKLTIEDWLTRISSIEKCTEFITVIFITFNAVVDRK